MRGPTKVALWLALGGLGIVGSVVAATSERTDIPPMLIVALAVSSVMWLVGAVFAVVGIVRMEKPRKPKAVAQSLGIVAFNALQLIGAVAALSVFIWVKTASNRRDREAAEDEEAKIKARVGDGPALQNELAARAVAGFKFKVNEAQRKYNSIIGMLEDPPILDLASATNRQNLLDRKEIVEEVIAGAEEFKRFSETVPQLFKDEFAKHKLTPAARDEALRGFSAKVEPLQAKILQLRDYEIQKSKIMLGLLEMLESTWGKWSYDAKGGELQTQDKNFREKYKKLSDELRENERLSAALQAEIRTGSQAK